LIEHEYDHVFVGTSDDDPRPDPDEVADYAWREPRTALAAAIADPADWSVWFRLALAELLGRSGKLPVPSPLGHASSS
jgi:isopentenyl-diphosphate delta-isomerase